MPRAAVKKTPRRAQEERREEAMTTILDAAEKLFADHGRDGVTVRMLGDAAGVAPALIHYYFEDLEGTYRAVFKRKSDVINQIRNRSMDEYLAAHGGKPTVAGAFEAFVRPVFETISADPAYWGNYAAIIGFATASRTQGREYMRAAHDATVHRFIELLMKIAPEVPRVEIYLFYHLLSGSLAVTLAQTGRLDSLSRGLCSSTDMMSILEPTIRVFTAGFEATRAKFAKPKATRTALQRPTAKSRAGRRA